ncbi:hypothetical protein EDD86DRAFT_278100 [Gorgonomyces haynaldii]|nr:hypothetical protein EDD86DRAFT_278100 [Gorgonomyces haynaldii]
MSSMRSRAGGRPMIQMLFDPYLPPRQLPLVPNKANRSIWWERMKKFFAANYAVYKIKKVIPGWKPKTFAQEAEELYVKMNSLFANRKKDELKNLVTEGMWGELNPQMKSLQKDVKWLSYGHVERPRAMHFALAKVQTERGEEEIVQATVKIQLKQGLELGEQKNVQTIEEYVVFEKWLDRSNGWKIAGKIQQ